MRPLLPLSVLLALSLTGCGATDHSATHFESMGDLSKAAESAGLDCGERLLDAREEEAIEANLAQNGWAQDGYGRTCVLMLFESDDKREWVKGNSLEPGEAWLEGGNWAINGGQYEIEAVAEEMGGELVGG